MKSLAVFLVSVCSIASFAQTGQTTSAASAAVRLSAEFTKKVDTKDAKAGDELAARTTADATLADGTELRRGTRLAGTIVEVRGKSGANSASLLAFAINRATLPDGQEIRLHSTATSMSAPTPRLTGDGPPDMENMAIPGARSSAAKPGGGSVRTPSAGSPGNSDPSAAIETKPSLPPGAGDPRAAGASARGTYISDAMQLHHYPVAGMPGVILSSQVTENISGALECQGQNIRVESGTRMTLDASVVSR